jgi:ubiquinone/menaquinone biosynthesis C-methylase UbiE
LVSRDHISKARLDAKEVLMAGKLEQMSFSDLEKTGWQSKADGYAEFVGDVTNQAVGPLLDAAAVRQGSDVLDVACGPGYAAGGARSRGAVAVGLDFAPSMVELATRNYPDCEFRIGDGQDLPFADSSFDAVTCMFGLLHMPDPERAIAEAHRVLRTGGRYAFTVWDTPDNHEFFRLVTSAIQRFGDVEVPLPPAPPMFRFADPVECRTALARAGFTDIDVQTIPTMWRGKSGQECLDLIYSGSVRTAMLLEHQVPETLNKIHDAIIHDAEALRKDGVIELAWPAILVSGTGTSEPRQ